MSSEFSDDEDSDFQGQAQALPVADFEEYDPNCPPLSGPEYLRRVQLEAKLCPATVVVEIDPCKLVRPSIELLNQVRG